MKNFILKFINKDNDNFGELKNYLTKKYKLELLVLFGSCATSKIWQGSDIDIGFLTKDRMLQSDIENFMLDIVRLSKFDKANAIDLYFDNEERLTKLKESKRGKELSLLQYKIYTTGKLLYERESGLFEHYKQRVSANSIFQNKNINKLIVEEKINFITTILEKINRIDNSSTKLHRAINDSCANKNVDQQLNKERAVLIDSLKDAVINNALNVIETAVRLNNFVLNEYCNTEISTRYESFIKLANNDKLTKEEKEKLEALAKTTMLNNFLTIDYYHGPWWSINHTVEGVKVLYLEYLNIIRKITV